MTISPKMVWSCEEKTNWGCHKKSWIYDYRPKNRGRGRSRKTLIETIKKPWTKWPFQNIWFLIEHMALSTQSNRPQIVGKKLLCIVNEIKLSSCFD